MLKLLHAELKRSWTLQFRYFGNTLGSLISVTIVFYALFLGTRYMAGPTAQFGERLDAIVVGYILWALLLTIIVGVANDLQDEAQTGTLEQVFLSPFGPIRVFLLRAVANLLWNLASTFAILLAILLLTGARLTFSISVLPPFAAMLLGAYGIAFMFGALALLLKRMHQLVNLFMFALLFVFMTSFETLPQPLAILGYLLPMAPSVSLLRELLARDLVSDPVVLTIAFANGLIYCFIGLLLFRQASLKIRKLGLLVGY